MVDLLWTSSSALVQPHEDNEDAAAHLVGKRSDQENGLHR